MSESRETIALLLNIKEQMGLDIEDELVSQCYELHKKYQFDSETKAYQELKKLIELSLDSKQNS